jgi:hypothetical protein
MKLKTLLVLVLLPLTRLTFAQQSVRDNAITYQQQRMVYQQWDQNKFTPTAGLLSLNPYYWLTWGLFYPNYHDTDRRPLSAAGPQTQRLALAGSMKAIDGRYQEQSDTLRNTALSDIANQTGSITDADPLWRLYYNSQFQPVLHYSASAILAGLPPVVGTQLIREGFAEWYTGEVEMLRQRLEAAHATDMDRGSRILAYHRLLLEYRQLAGIWAMRASAATTTLRLTRQQPQPEAGLVKVGGWTSQSDIQIARRILTHVR